MNKTRTPIYFYLPKKDLPKTGVLPPNGYMWWPAGDYGMSPDIYAWLFRTYKFLTNSGFECQLVNSMPKKGIVVLFRTSVDEDEIPESKNVITVSILGGGNKPNFYSQLYIVGNKRWLEKVPDSHFIPHWPEPSLIPRDPSRGDRFENIAYIGEVRNLDPELRTEKFKTVLENLGLKWHIVGRERIKEWNDYHFIDAIVAVRKFKGGVEHKHAQKLYNAWLAGVPAIVGPEIGYKEERRSELDFIEIHTSEELINAVKHLRDNLQLRRKMIENGKIRAREITTDETVKKWVCFFQETAIPAYNRWIKLFRLNKEIFFFKRHIFFKSKIYFSKLLQIRGKMKGVILNSIRRS